MIQALLVEDDRDLAASIADYLLLENIQCDHAYNGPAGVELAQRNPYDIILLDIMLPQLDGLGVCRQLRHHGIGTAVLMLTARDTLEDKLGGFRAGTDDYLVKPFAMEELVARIRALAGRSSGQIRRLQIADLEMDLLRREVKRGGKTINLTSIAWILLETLMRASPRVVERIKLERAVWADEPPDSNSLKVHLFKLRQLIDKPFSTALIHTIPGHGFTLREQKEEDGIQADLTA